MVRNAVGAVIFQGTEFLIVHKVKLSSLRDADENIDGEWDFPKGGVEESDEDLTEAIFRELFEETGSTRYKVIEQLDEKISFAFDKDFANKTSYKKQETTMFIVEYLGDRSDLLPIDTEIDKVEFLTLEEAFKRLTHEDTKRFFTRNQPKIKEYTLEQT